MRGIPKLIAIVALALAAPLAVHADDAHHDADFATTAGVVKKIDKDQGKITIQHGPLENLAMPAMTMVFRAKGPELLDNVKAGDNIQFVADKLNGAFTVTKIVVAK